MCDLHAGDAKCCVSTKAPFTIMSSLFFSSSGWWVLAMTFLFLVSVFLYNLYRVLHIIKRDIGHNAVAQVEDEAGFVLHPVEQAIDAVFNYFFIGI